LGYYPVLVVHNFKVMSDPKYKEISGGGGKVDLKVESH
jgi:hypothetical protein